MRAILFYDTGELGNRLVSYAYLLAYSAEHRVPITNLCFWRYADLFDRPFSFSEKAWIPLAHSNIKKSAADRLLSLALATPWLKRIRQRFCFDGRLVCSPKSLVARALMAFAGRFGSTVKAAGSLLEFDVREESQWQHQSKLLVSRSLKHLPLTDTALPVKHADLLRTQFRLTAPIRERLSSFMTILRARHQRLIGIHIRQGDYSKYRGGKWLFDMRTYHRIATHLASLYPHESVGFIISTNGSVSLDEFTGLCIYPAQGDLALDMYALAGCDLVVGPPSTFSGWASFVGNTPIYFIEDAMHLPSKAELTGVWVPRFY